MDLSSARALARDVVNDGLGTAMTGTVPHGSPVSTRVLWDSAELDAVGRSRQLAESFWVPTADFPSIPRGTLFVGPGPYGGDDRTWRVDKTEEVKFGRRRALVTEVE